MVGALAIPGEDRGLRLAPWQHWDWFRTIVRRNGDRRYDGEVFVLGLLALGGFLGMLFMRPVDLGNGLRKRFKKARSAINSGIAIRMLIWLFPFANWSVRHVRSIRELSVQPEA